MYELAFSINETSKVDIYRDENDNFLLELCQDSNADFLITGDNVLFFKRIQKYTKLLQFKILFQKWLSAYILSDYGYCAFL